MAAGLMIFLLGGTSLALARLPYSYVSIDVNPSIEYTLNWFDRVLSLRAVNEDAEPIIQNLQENGVVNQPIDIAIGMTIKSLNDMQYFKDGAENDVVIAVASFGLKDVNRLSGILKVSAGIALTDHALKVTVFLTDTKKINEAQKYHATAGKLVIVENLASSVDGLQAQTKEEWLRKPVREILSHINGAVKAVEKVPENREHATEPISTASIQPEESDSLPLASPKKMNSPKLTDVPNQKNNSEKSKQPDATPKLMVEDKPENSPAPKRMGQDPETGTPPKDADSEQGKGHEAPEYTRDPKQSTDDGDHQKGKP